MSPARQADSLPCAPGKPINLTYTSLNIPILFGHKIWSFSWHCVEIGESYNLKSTGGENGNSLQYFCLGNPMNRGAWQAIVHMVTKSWTWLKWLNTHTHTHTHTIWNASFRIYWKRKKLGPGILFSRIYFSVVGWFYSSSSLEQNNDYKLIITHFVIWLPSIINRFWRCRENAFEQTRGNTHCSLFSISFTQYEE